MNRAEAWRRVDGSEDLDFETLDEIFRAFGFLVESPNFETEVYYHPAFRCGAYTARDDGLHLVTPGQRSLVRRMLRCVEAFEKARST